MKNKDIAKAIRKICITKTQDETTDAKMDKQNLSDALAAYDNSKNLKSIIFETDIWRIVMKNPIIKIATAAVIIIICFTGLHFWKSTGSGIALADVLAAIEKVTGFTYKIDAVVTIQGNSTNSTSTVLVSKDYGVKSIGEVIDPNTGKVTRQESYFLTQSNSQIWFNHDEKTYHRVKFEDTTSQNNNKEEYIDLNNPETIIKQFLSCDHISLGQSKLDGVTVEGFQTTDPAYKQVFGNLGSYLPVLAERINVKIWVDVKTFLPVRHEQEIITKSGVRIYHVVNDFQWNVAVNASDFEPNIPDDYTNPTGNVTLDFTEKNAIEGLKLFADLAKHYPADPNGTNFIDQIREFVGYNDGSWEDLSEDEKERRNNDILKPLVGFAVFYKMLFEENKDPVYYGETVKPGDADEVLLRWKLDDGQYRIIFGDLSVKTVTAEELAELEKGANINAKNNNGQTPLHQACSRGDKDMAEFLISKGADIEAKNKWGGTPLHHAARFGHQNVAEILIAAGADINVHADVNNKNWNGGWTALHMAARNNRVDVAELLITKGADVNSKDNWIRTPLHHVAMTGHKEVGEILIAGGADIEAKDRYDHTALHSAAYSGHPEMAKWLIDHRADIEVKDKYGMTPLHFAVDRNHMDVLKLLLERGADVNGRTGYTQKPPLFIAANNGHKNMVDLLLCNGADVQARHHGLTVLNSAMSKDQEDMVRYFIEKGLKTTSLHLAAYFGKLDDVKEKITSSGTDINTKDNSGFTPLHCAVCGGKRDVVEYLINNSAKVDIRDFCDCTPLHYAARKGNEEIVKLLVNEGADVNLREAVGRNPLYLAASAGHKTIVEIFINEGADVNVRHSEGYTPLHQASSFGYEDVVELLLAKGARIDLKAEDGRTALHLACERGHKNVVKLLIEKNADINAMTNDGQTPLDLAKQYLEQEIVELLSKHGAKK